MGDGVVVEEQVYQKHYRVILVRSGGKHLYSIDYYKRLATKPGCNENITIDESPAHLCYINIGDGCEVVVVVADGRIEIVNLRLTVDASNDPAEGDPGKARELCIGRVEAWLSKAGRSAV